MLLCDKESVPCGHNDKVERVLSLIRDVQCLVVTMTRLKDYYLDVHGLLITMTKVERVF